MSTPLSRRVETLESRVREKDAPLQIVCVAEDGGETIERAMMKKFGTPEPPADANVLVVITGVERHSDGEA